MDQLRQRRTMASGPKDQEVKERHQSPGLEVTDFSGNPFPAFPELSRRNGHPMPPVLGNITIQLFDSGDFHGVELFFTGESREIPDPAPR